MLKNFGNATISEAVDTVLDLCADQSLKLRIGRERFGERDVNTRIAEGIEQGIAEGIEHGIEQGKSDQKKLIISKMRDQGYSEKQIKELVD